MFVSLEYETVFVLHRNKYTVSQKVFFIETFSFFWSYALEKKEKCFYN